MSIKNKYRKLKRQLRIGGTPSTVKSGIKYLIFLMNERIGRLRRLPKNEIVKGKIRVVCSDCGINIFWDGIELTGGIGLNIGINTLGRWTNSAKANWQIKDKKSGCFKIRVVFEELPLAQAWSLKIEDGCNISWDVDMKAEKRLRIDELRIISVVNERYNSWFDDCRQGVFSPADNKWHDLHSGALPASLVGARFQRKGYILPALILEKRGDATGNLTPIVQNPPLAENKGAHIIGFRKAESAAGGDYPAGEYCLFSGSIRLIKDDSLLPDAGLNKTDRQHGLSGAIKGRTAGFNAKKKPRILLVNLPWQKGARWGVRAGSRWPHIKDDLEEGNYLPFPFFLAYAASLLEAHGFEAYLIDALAEKTTNNGLLRHIHKLSPDLLVVETSTPSLNHDLKLLKAIGNDNFKICLCGPDINIRTAEFLKGNRFVDYVLIGEYEHTLLGLAESLSAAGGLSDVCGLAYRNGGGIKINPPGALAALDTLPWPLREGLPMDRYMDTPGRIPLPSVQMLASRGCPFGCNFCLWPQVMYHGNTYRQRDVVDVADEMEYLVKNMGFKSVYFDDDTFNIGKERMLRFCSEIKNRGLEKTPWAIMARPDLMDEEILVRMKGAGLEAVKYGVESASQALLDSCGKRMDLRKAEQMIRLSKATGIKIHLTFTFGLPGETRETIQRTIDYALELKPHSAQFSITTPFPGTAYFEELDKRGLVVNKNWDDYDGNFKSVIRSDTLTSRDFESARIRAYRLWCDSSQEDRDLKRYWKDFCESQRRKGLGFSLGKAANYLRKNKNLSNFVGKVRDNYLDLLGIYNGRIAFKGPHTVQIDLTDHCNNNCIACWCNSPLLSKERLSNPKAMLPTGLAKSFISEIRRLGTKEIYFSGGGEPFMHPDILEIVGHAKSQGMACSINTNFTLLNDDIIQRLIDLKVDGLTVSVWAGAPDIYIATHPNKSKQDFCRIEEMLRLLNSRKIFYPTVKLYNVICNINYDRIGQMFDFARGTKSEFIEFTVVDTIPGATDKLMLTQGQREYILQYFNGPGKKVKEEGSYYPKALNLEHFIRRVSNTGSQKAEYDSRFIDGIPCYAGWLFARVMPNGDVNSCLKSHRFPVGNIHKQPFKEIWNSEMQAYFRKKTLAARKEDPFFSLIGNDPDCKVGCYKSCDDINRNISMHNKVNGLAAYEKAVLKFLGKVGLGRLIGV